jgi:diguanylate cyclase
MFGAKSASMENAAMPLETVYNAVLISIGMLAIANIFYSGFARQIWSRRQKDVACGLLFSTAAIMVMAQGVQLGGTFYFDSRAVFITIGAAYGGPIAAIICILFVGAFRLFQGGEAAMLGACSVAVIAVLASVWGHLMRKEYSAPALAPLIVLGMIASLPLMLTPYLPIGLSDQDKTDLVLVLTFSNIALVLLFGSLLMRESRLFANERQLEIEAKTDALTGLLNRRSFNLDLATALKAKETVSVLLIDLDYFKKINDSHGHDAGDAVLIECGRIFKNAVRASDPVYRVGGEEFAVLLRYSTPEIAHLIAVSITQATRREPVWFHGKSIPVTASIGVVTGAGLDKTNPDKEATALLKRADIALYAAKSGGRDQAVVFNATEAAPEVLAA